MLLVSVVFIFIILQTQMWCEFCFSTLNTQNVLKWITVGLIYFQDCLHVIFMSSPLLYLNNISCISMFAVNRSCLLCMYNVVCSNSRMCSGSEEPSTILSCSDFMMRHLEFSSFAAELHRDTNISGCMWRNQQQFWPVKQNQVTLWDNKEGSWMF